MPEVAADPGRLQRLWQEAAGLWAAGGWAMWGIAAIALVMFAMGMHIHLGLRSKGYRAIAESRWRRWIDHPRDRRGPIGGLLDFILRAGTVAEAASLSSQLHHTETAAIRRDLNVMRICVSAAPLVGLLGTVTGMLATFGALATGSGGKQTMAQIADGISEALITTETGLVIALPGLFFQYQLTRACERYQAFLAHLETVCTQTVHRRVSGDVRRQARRQARDRVLAALREAVS